MGRRCLTPCTGGDRMGTFNVSTAAAFVAAGAGAVVAKHGNRAVTSHCGSADVLEALGVKIDLPPEGVAHCLREVGIGFMFAPTFHPAMRFAAGPRREIGVRSVFNILGPLTNPAGARAQVLGVADAAIGEKMTQVLGHLGCRHALVVHGEDGLDEMSLGGPTLVYELKEGDIRSYRVTPEEAGLRQASGQAVKGGSPEENAAAMRAVFGGEQGALRDIVLLNSAAALVAADKAKTLRAAYAIKGKPADLHQGIGTDALLALTASIDLQRMIPDCSNTPSQTSALAAKAPVCDWAAAAPAAVRPPLMARIGLGLSRFPAISRAACISSRPREISSRYIRITSV